VESPFPINSHVREDVAFSTFVLESPAEIQKKKAIYLVLVKGPSQDIYYLLAPCFKVVSTFKEEERKK